jgi:hypothetical protein
MTAWLSPRLTRDVLEKAAARSGAVAAVLLGDLNWKDGSDRRRPYCHYDWQPAVIHRGSLHKYGGVRRNGSAPSRFGRGGDRRGLERRVGGRARPRAGLDVRRARRRDASAFLRLRAFVLLLYYILLLYYGGLYEDYMRE